MKLKFLFLIILIPALAFGQTYKKHTVQKDRLTIQLSDGVTEPGVTEWNVYLPKSTTWYDFWTGKRFTAAQAVKAAAPQDKIPVFVKAGSIVPMGKFMQYTSEKPMDTLEIRVYTGADGQFTLYNDE